MKLALCAVGKPRRRESDALASDYRDRIRTFGVRADERFVAETRVGKQYDAAHAREREARALTKEVPAGWKVVALDRAGRSLDSEAFAAFLERSARPGVCFLIGGPTGLAPSIVESADRVLSLSAMTLPHELARVILWEQAYRALTILRRIPYHK